MAIRYLERSRAQSAARSDERQRIERWRRALAVSSDDAPLYDDSVFRRRGQEWKAIPESHFSSYSARVGAVWRQLGDDDLALVRNDMLSSLDALRAGITTAVDDVEPARPREVQALVQITEVLDRMVRRTRQGDERPDTRDPVLDRIVRRVRAGSAREEHVDADAEVPAAPQVDPSDPPTPTPTTGLDRWCSRHGYDKADDRCTRCAESFCSSFLVYPHGEAMCMNCALVRSGVRARSRTH